MKNLNAILKSASIMLSCAFVTVSANAQHTVKVRTSAHSYRNVSVPSRPSASHHYTPTHSSSSSHHSSFRRH